MTVNQSYCTSRVPLASRLNLMNITLIRVGQWTSLSQFMLGAVLGHAMTFGQAMMATLCGSVFLELLSLGLGIAGAREGLPGSLLARFTGFGRIGSLLVGGIIAISLMGWFGVQNAILAKSLDYFARHTLGFAWAAVLSGLTLTALVAFGVQALKWTARVSVPLFGLVVCWITFLLIREHNLPAIITSVPSGTPLSLGTAITIVAGGCMTGAFTTPDICRYCRSSRDVVWMTLISIVIGEFVVNGIAILIAHSLGTSDVVTIMGQTAGWIGLLTVVLSTLKINDLNLYSSSLGIASVIEGLTGRTVSWGWLTVILGGAGTLLSLLGMLDRFMGFLVFLGILFPPVMGVMLTDYYILRTHRRLLVQTRGSGNLPEPASIPSGWLAVISCIAGTTAGVALHVGIPSLNSLLVASVVYILLKRYADFGVGTSKG